MVDIVTYIRLHDMANVCDSLIMLRGECAESKRLSKIAAALREMGGVLKKVVEDGR